MTADYVCQNDALSAVNIKGCYEGYPAEGSPKTDWQATVSFAYDPAARVTKEDLAITSFAKMFSRSRRVHCATRSRSSN